MIFIEGDKAWCLLPQGAQRLIFLFFSNQHSAPNLLSSLALFHHHSLFLHVSDWVTVCPQASAAASLVPALHTDCVYW